MKNRSHAHSLSARRRSRRHGTTRLFVLGAAMVGAANMPRTVMAAPADGQGSAITGHAERSPVQRYDIPAGVLATVLAQFESVSEIKAVVTDPGLRAVQSPGVAGNFTPEQAMAQLLIGLSVHATFSGNSVMLDVRGVNEFVAVSSDLPKPESPKYRAPVLDTPQTLVVIPEQVFQQQNAQTLREVLRNTPGITMSIGEGGSGGTSSGDNVLIRGFSARNDIYVDGARDVGLVSRDMFNTETVEVAKGPSSVTTGRGSTGGSINLVTKSANLSNASTVRLGGGSADYRRGTFDVNRKLTNTVGVRFNGMWQDIGYAGRDVAKYRGWGFAPSVGLGLGTATQLTVGYSRMQQDNIPDWGIPTLLPDAAIAQGITINDLNFRNFYGIASRDYEKTTSDIATVTLDHKFNRMLSVRNLTRYGKNYRDAVLTPPRPATSTAGQGPEDPGYDPLVAQIRRTDTKYQYRNDRVATNQTDLTSTFKTGSVDHSADIGLEIARDHQPTHAFTDLFTNGRPPVDDLFNPTPYVSYTPALAHTGATSDAHAKSAAIYAFDTITLSRRLSADLGIRWDHIDVDYASVATNGVVSPFGRTDRAFSGRTGLIFKPTAVSTIYGVYSTSFTPSFDGTLGLTLAATGVNSQALPPELTRNIEVGTKWDLARHVLLTAAVFDTEKTNAKTTALSGATVLAGDQRVRGVEFGLSGNITPAWGAFGGLSLMNGVVKDSGIPTEIGAQLPYVPKASANLWTTYRLPMGLTLGGGTNYSNGNYFNQTGGFLFVAGGTVAQTKYVQNAAAVQALTKYWVVNAMATYPVNRHLELQVNLNNITNERYADRAYDRHFLPGPARQILFSPVITF